MNRLPTEIVDDIVSLLVKESILRHDDYYPQPYPELIPYASVSISFQHAVERRTFKFIHADSSQLPRLQEMFTSHRRRSNLRHLDLQVVLPPYAKRYRARLEREKDRRANNEVFSIAVKSLFDILQGWESESAGPFNAYGITFSIEAWSPSDNRRRQRDWTASLFRRGPDSSDSDSDPNSEWSKLRDIGTERFERSELTLGDIEDVPTLQTITRFYLETMGTLHRNIRPSSLTTLARKMPNLESIEWLMWDNEKWAKFHKARCERRLGEYYIPRFLIKAPH
jgi:hypothetical protein